MTIDPAAQAMPLLADPNSSSATLRLIAQTVPHLRVCVALHPNADESVLALLAADADPQVQAAVAAARQHAATASPSGPDAEGMGAMIGICGFVFGVFSICFLGVAQLLDATNDPFRGVRHNTGTLYLLAIGTSVIGIVLSAIGINRHRRNKKSPVVLPIVGVCLSSVIEVGILVGILLTMISQSIMA